MRPGLKLSRFLSLIAATIAGNIYSSWGATQVCSTSLDAVAITRDLDSLRPAPVGPDQRDATLRKLPEQGRVHHLIGEDAKKIQDVSKILRQHDRQSVYTVVVVDVAQARVHLYDRSIILVTLPAIRLLSSAEFQATVSHEIGHEYVWDEYYGAKARGDGSCLRQLELFCDAVAVITLGRLGLDPGNLISGLARIQEFNEQFGKARDEGTYPQVKERQAFVKQVVAAAKKGKH